MKYLIIIALTFPLFTNAQLDTIANGKVESVDSLLGIKTIYPFKKSLVNGKVQGFFLSDNKLAYEGEVKNNQKQGTWNWFSYDTLGSADTIKTLNYANDTLNGFFMILEDSMRTIGSYKNGRLGGAYKREFFSIDDTGAVFWTPIDSGQYADSIMYGQWTFFADGKLHKTGFYENGKKHKHWIIYDLYEKSPKDMVIREVQYFEGKKTGSEKVHFHYDFESKQDGSDDTIKIEEFEQIPWQNGSLMGSYFKKDKAGNILESGTYNNGKKVAKWEFSFPNTKEKEIRTYLDDNLNGPFQKTSNDHLILEGTYAMGKKNKTWKYFDDNAQLMREETYDNGIKTGEWKYFNNKGYVALLKVFEDDELISISENNAVEVPVLEISITNNDGSFELVSTELFSDSTEVKTYLYNVKDINHNDFMETFKTNRKDTSIFILHGGYMVKKSGAMEYTGSYNMNLMNGNWDYFYNSSITWRKTFNDGILTKELFLDKMTGQPIEKGEYVLWYGPERPKIEFKIKEGIRHGKSTWYLRSGEVQKEEKYKEGVLQ
jgi:antitoxin component YwqK of YwqJK toxin-antitoxin module